MKWTVNWETRDGLVAQEERECGRREWAMFMRRPLKRKVHSGLETRLYKQRRMDTFSTNKLETGVVWYEEISERER